MLICVYREPLTCECSCKPAWPLSCNGVTKRVLLGGCCWCWGAAVDLWELEDQFGGGTAAPTCPLLQHPDLCEGNLLWRRRLGVRGG